MEKLKKIGKSLFDIYFGIGVVAIGLLAILVCFAVIMRYFFSISWKELSEFNVTLFAFTTFWGLGVNILKNEHVIIDILFNTLKAPVKKILSIVDYFIVLIVVVVFTYESVKYVAMAGQQLSMGMEIPMKYMYGIMPVSGAICALCTIIKIADLFTRPLSAFENKKEEN